jgi:uncharacterized protein YqgC (DUF456 family)
MEFWEILVITIGAILSIVGIVGCIFPAVPGPPLNYIALLVLHFSGIYEFTTTFLIVYLVINIIVQVLDYVLPVYGAKRYGASKKGIWGSVIGIVLGFFFFPPFGVILGALIGAVAGELVAGKKESEAMRAGFATFIASLIMMVAKLILSVIMTYYFVMGIV